MDPNDTLFLGRIPFLHMALHNRRLADAEALGPIAWRDASPSELNAMLAAGEIAGAPASSIEYARCPDHYVLLPDFSVSNRRDSPAVGSVLAFTRRPLERLTDLRPQHRIAASRASATSAALLRILLAEEGGAAPLEGPPPDPDRPGDAEAEAVLLIGDAALAAHPDFTREPTLPPNQWVLHDLGELWTRRTGWPFVFALYILNAQAAERHAFRFHTLRAVLQEVGPDARLARELASTERYGWLTPERILHYWSQLHYGLEKPWREGLELFFRLAHRYGLIPAAPTLRFLW